MTIGFNDIDRKTSDILEDVIATMRGQPITLRQLLKDVGESGLLLLCGLLSLPFLIPVSIPGVSTVFGAGIVLFGAAITFNQLPWLPEKLADRALDSDRLVPVLERGIGILRRLDRYIRPRLPQLTKGALMNRFNGLTLTFAGILLMMPLGFIPFSNTLPGVAILFLSAGISQRDGAVVAAGYALVLLTLAYFSGLAYGAYAAGQSLFG